MIDKKKTKDIVASFKNDIDALFNDEDLSLQEEDKNLRIAL